MKDWQKLLLDPAAYTVLRQLVQEPKTKQELSEETGIKPGRMDKLVKKLLENELITQNVENGVRKLEHNINHDHVKQLRIEIEEFTTNHIEDEVKLGNFQEARQKIHDKPMVEDLHKRKSLAKIEALQKLEQLPQTDKKQDVGGSWQSLKGFIPRL
ncbi:MarR family transcriptional regulator [Candidatus Nanohalobium constans]|uniref:Uncharacterized protein n=1 Tax=Candidatus Nanohalobium constans TaxID=2565781 RepID=A0A5Q0UFY6_9ARCH|nr:helix-turn-helix domain-containing protein [Candidatus Nanohalobium constans]QGA80552.1 hypothetical protein LC1Nh_0661 [Candidatus Nanohalobium constans]